MVNIFQRVELLGMSMQKYWNVATNKTIQRPKKIYLITMHFRKKGNLAVQDDLSGSTYYSGGTVIKITSHDFLASFTVVDALRVLMEGRGKRLECAGAGRLLKPVSFARNESISFFLTILLVPCSHPLLKTILNLYILFLSTYSFLLSPLTDLFLCGVFTNSFLCNLFLVLCSLINLVAPKYHPKILQTLQNIPPPDSLSSHFF